MELHGAWQLQQSVGRIIKLKPTEKKIYYFQNVMNGVLKMIITFKYLIKYQ